MVWAVNPRDTNPRYGAGVKGLERNPGLSLGPWGPQSRPVACRETPDGRLWVAASHALSRDSPRASRLGISAEAAEQLDWQHRALALCSPLDPALSLWCPRGQGPEIEKHGRISTVVESGVARIQREWIALPCATPLWAPILSR